MWATQTSNSISHFEWDDDAIVSFMCVCNEFEIELMIYVTYSISAERKREYIKKDIGAGASWLRNDTKGYQ